jgi:excisionase family DNA binding protein
MNHERTQSGRRENTASRREHAPRLATNVRKLQSDALPLTVHKNEPAASPKPTNGAKGGEVGDRLLTVHEVADLLSVPVSWVYGRTRKRSLERLPGIRLGKYWRFREGEVRAWVECQRGGNRAA